MQTVNETLAAIWAFYGHIAEAIFDLIQRINPQAHFVAYLVAALWPFLITLVALWVVIYTHDRLTMRRIRRDIQRRTLQSGSILRDRSN